MRNMHSVASRPSDRTVLGSLSASPLSPVMRFPCASIILLASILLVVLAIMPFESQAIVLDKCAIVRALERFKFQRSYLSNCIVFDKPRAVQWRLTSTI